MDEELQNSFCLIKRRNIDWCNQKISIFPYPINSDFKNYLFQPQDLTFLDLFRFLLSIGPNYTSKIIQSKNRNIKNIQIIENTSKQEIFKINVDINLEKCRISLIQKNITLSECAHIKGFDQHSKHALYMLQRDITYADEKQLVSENKIFTKFSSKSAFIQIMQYLSNRTSNIIFKKLVKTTCYKSILTDKNPETDYFKTDNGFWEFHEAISPIDTLKIFDRHIHSFVYIVNEFKAIIDHGNCIELDASFYVLNPFVFCIPLIIIGNESIPIGLSVGPSEKSNLYEQFYNFLKKIDQNSYERLKEIPVLSDEGSALEKFCSDNNLQHFLCFVHILRKFGSSSKLGGLIKGLIYQKSEEEFKKSWRQKMPNILKELKENPQHIKRFEKLFNCSVEDNSISDPDFTHQSLWNREIFHIPATTNHIESCHSHVNAAVRQIRKPFLKVKALITFIHNRMKNFYKRPNLKKAVNCIKALAKIKEKHCKNMGNEKCRCKNNFKKSLFCLDCDFPCIHNVYDFVIEEYPHFQAEEHEAVIEFTKEKIQENWYFEQKQEFSKFTFDDDDLLVYQTLGRPKESILSNTILFLGHTKKKKALKGYLEILFVHFCSHFYGKYSYEEEVVQKFYNYAADMTQRKDVVLEELQTAQKRQRDQIIESYKSNERKLSEYEIQEQIIESDVHYDDIATLEQISVEKEPDNDYEEENADEEERDEEKQEEEKPEEEKQEEEKPEELPMLKKQTKENELVKRHSDEDNLNNEWIRISTVSNKKEQLNKIKRSAINYLKGADSLSKFKLRLNNLYEKLDLLNTFNEM